MYLHCSITSFTEVKDRSTSSSAVWTVFSWFWLRWKPCGRRRREETLPPSDQTLCCVLGESLSVGRHLLPPSSFPPSLVLQQDSLFLFIFGAARNHKASAGEQGCGHLGKKVIVSEYNCFQIRFVGVVHLLVKILDVEADYWLITDSRIEKHVMYL